MNKLKETKNILAKRIFLNNLDDCKIFPKYLMLETIKACNSRCIMCGTYNVNSSKYGGVLLSQNLFDKILEELKHYGDWIEMVVLYARGEPLLDKTICEKIKKLREIGIKRIQISTNASLLTEDKTRELFKSGLNDLRFSIDSIKKETYEKIRVGLNYDEVMKNATNAIKIRDEEFPKIPIRVRAVEMEINKGEKEEWLSFWRSHLKDIDVAQYMPYREDFAEGGGVQERKTPCISPFSSFNIRADGTVPLCCDKFNDKYTVGNIKEQTITEIWRSNIYENIRNLHLSYEWSKFPLCKNCILWD